MLILGIDPGIGRCGFGLVSLDGSKLKTIDYGCIETAASFSIEERLLIINEEIGKMVKKYKPDVVSVEELFFGANSKTALLVGQARGVVLLAAAKNHVLVTQYSPLQVKIALTGYGRADKNQIGQMVKIILGLEKIPKLDDTTDALAIAITHAFSFKIGKLNKQ